MSLRIDTSPWIPGALLIGNTGGGVLAQALATTGDNGDGYLANDVTLPADNGKEICGRFTYVPPGLTLFAYEDGSLTASGADGTYNALYQLYVDYVPIGSPVALSMTFGTPSVTITASWAEGSETISATASVINGPGGAILDEVIATIISNRPTTIQAHMSSADTILTVSL
jgi:hypothetical protein